MTKQFSTTTGYVLRTAAEIEKHQHEWLWRGRMPLLGITILGGLEGTGKTQMVNSLVGLATTGNLPGFYEGEPFNVVLVTNEDDWSSLHVPRLEAEGADLTRVHFFEVPPGVGLPMFPEKLDDLVQACQHVDARLAVLDPMMKYLSLRADASKDLQRATLALETIRHRLEPAQVSVLGLMHPNKGSDHRVFLDTLWGSRGITASARAVLAVVADHEDPSIRLVLQPKNSGGKRSPLQDTPAFAIEPVGGITDVNGVEMDGVIRCRWENTHRPGIDPNEYLGQDRTTASQAKDAREALLLYLIDCPNGEQPSVVIEAIRRNKATKDLSERTLQRAYEGLVIEALAEPNKRRRHGVWHLTPQGRIEAEALRQFFGIAPEPKKPSKRPPRPKPTGTPSKRPARPPRDQEDADEL